jgi:ELWxxDGT repeat protein
MRTRSVILLLLLILTSAATAAADFESYTPLRGGRVVFLSFDPSDASRCGLWATDGTAGGTERLAELCGSGEASRPRILDTNGDLAFFTDSRRHLWRTDGTAEGTILLQPVEVAEGRITAGYDSFFLFVFSGCTRTEGCEPWASDGTPGGTRLLRDLNPGSRSSNPTAFTINDGQYILFGATRREKYGLWSTDGEDYNTVRLVQTRLPVQKIVSVGRPIYFAAWDSNTAEAWVLQPWHGNASKIKEFFTHVRAAGVDILTVGRRLFLTAVEPDSRAVVFLWETNGTARGTRLLGEFSFIGQMFNLGGRTVFEAAQGTPTTELWYLDPGTTVPRRLLGCPMGCPRLDGVPIVKRGHRIFFSGWDATRGHELWTSDGTAEGTRPLKNLCPGPCDGRPGRFRVVGDHILFSTAAGDLWVTDGTTPGTVRLAALPPDDLSPHGPPLDLAEADGLVVFTGFDPVDGPQPWVTDLTPAGTRPIAQE